jgi:hypothetical protein
LSVRIGVLRKISTGQAPWYQSLNGVRTWIWGQEVNAISDDVHPTPIPCLVSMPMPMAAMALHGFNASWVYAKILSGASQSNIAPMAGASNRIETTSAAKLKPHSRRGTASAGNPVLLYDYNIYSPNSPVS